MKRPLQGIAILLFCMLLTLGSGMAGWRTVFDLDIYWQEVFMIFGAAGLVFAFLPEKK